MTKTVTIDVPIEVRKNDDGTYQFQQPDGSWGMAFMREDLRTAMCSDHLAIVQAIDSGAFVDPLPSAEGAHIYNPELKVHFFRANVLRSPWVASQRVGDILWHTPEQVQSYGPFEVLYDPEKKEG